jgi:hypothetical protein
VPYSGAIVDYLTRLGWLSEPVAGDRREVGAAISMMLMAIGFPAGSFRPARKASGSKLSSIGTSRVAIASTVQRRHDKLVRG